MTSYQAIGVNTICGVIVNIIAIYAVEITLYKEIFALIALAVSYTSRIFGDSDRSLVVQIVSFVLFVLTYVFLRFSLIGL